MRFMCGEKDEGWGENEVQKGGSQTVVRTRERTGANDWAKRGSERGNAGDEAPGVLVGLGFDGG